jgi:hypothetical protein
MQALLQRKGLPPVEGEPSLPASGEDGHQGHGVGGFTALVPATARDTARLAPLFLAVFAIAWLVIGTIHRRRVWAGLAEPAASPPRVWQLVAIGGLAASAALHLGLAPSHFKEATVQGVFFCAASVATGIIAAIILAWPSRPAYIAGAVIALAWIVLWAVFALVPPPGAEVAEDVELVGLLTKATELVAIMACIVLWFRARRIHLSGRVSPDDSVAL